MFTKILLGIIFDYFTFVRKVTGLNNFLKFDYIGIIITYLHKWLIYSYNLRQYNLYKLH